MRTLLTCLTAAAAAATAAGVLALVPGADAAPHPAAAPHTSYAATATTVVRPVTAAGRAAPGFAVHRETQYPVDCSEPGTSPGSVSPHVQWCYPSAAYAIACWKAAAPHRTLCLRNPRSKNLDLLRYSGRFATAGVAKSRDRAPLVIVLRDGTLCSIRDGGAWGALEGHKNLYGSYSCARHGVVWATDNAAHAGVDETAASWTVRTAPFRGRHLVTRHIRRAFFVGTAAG